ncbi:hypothetical protein [Noviherbaspirillum saxi]|uniref:Uncharacterized protein n=1 Tax=Noviherbaspirillum saxi TaxID=2320863 RepID=A0A3A3FMY4_9BURK|nr:hypothetical protein [Noviherbaspirillum saxi]RJF97577.1 hypothetical protein D3871_02815 [Noviherbaspirillum saxi]
MKLSKIFSRVLGRARQSLPEEHAAYDYLVAYFGDFTVSQALQLEVADYDTPNVRREYDTFHAKDRHMGFNGAALHANQLPYLMRLRLCRLILQRQIETELRVDCRD